MPKFRKKPVVIEAVQFDGTRTSVDHIEALSPGAFLWLGNSLRIGTLEGEMAASHGDWIIKGVKGEVYPCKPAIFTATYEAVE